MIVRNIGAYLPQCPTSRTERQQCPSMLVRVWLVFYRHLFSLLAKFTGT